MWTYLLLQILKLIICIWNKNFNRLCYNVTKHKAKKFFCKHCIIIIIIIIIIIQTFVLNAPINEEHHIGARSARRESVNLKQASFQ